MASQDVRRHPYYGLLSRLYNGASITVIQSALTPSLWARDWYDWWYPPADAPNFVKAYDCRPHLPIRIFLPESYDETDTRALPTIFMIHGGGFCLGRAADDDEWNRRFADLHKFLVIELNYSKAPQNPFPIAVYDLEALMLAAYKDESLPIDGKRIAVGGFSAGGNLALAVCQLPSIRDKVKPTAAIPIYPVVDLSIGPRERTQRRHYKPDLTGLRGRSYDFLSRLSPFFNWSYLPYGQDLTDPLLSPIFAPRDRLPPHVFITGAELDQLGHEAWRMACQLAGRPEPSPENKLGQDKPAKGKGHLILDDERFAFQRVQGNVGVRWLLVPDQIHGFDHVAPAFHGSEEAFRDARLKMEEHQKILGEWLRDEAWK